MRLKRSSAGWLVSCRSGVIARVIIRNRNAHRPSRCSMAATGSAPRPPLPVRNSSRICQARIAAGVSASRCTRDLLANRARGPGRHTFMPATSSEPLLQVEAGVHAGHLVGIAVEQARRNALGEELAGGAGDAPLGLLAPARMVDVRVDVGEEAVLAGLEFVPGGLGHLLDEIDGDD